MAGLIERIRRRGRLYTKRFHGVCSYFGRVGWLGKGREGMSTESIKVMDKYRSFGMII